MSCRRVTCSRKTLDISFFIPCHNKGSDVINAIDKLVRVSNKLELSFEILVFCDCSKDRTIEVVKSYHAANPFVPVRLFTDDVNRGDAQNFFDGAFSAYGRCYRLVCGDDIEPIESHEKLLRHIGEADIIVPYYEAVEGQPFHRRFMSCIYTWLANSASGYRVRYYNGGPIYRRFDVMRFHVEATGLGYQAEFLTRLIHEGKSVVEVPLVSIDRGTWNSLNLRNCLSVPHSLLKIAQRRMGMY